MKKLTCVLLGCGDRTCKYATYAKLKPEELEVIGAIDINPFKLEMAKAEFHLKDEVLYGSLEEFLKADVRCDFIINGTMDQYHYETTIPLLKKGYNMLLEKPITSKPEELTEIQSCAEENHCKIVICHVARYTPFYSTIKRVLDTGKLGSIMDMQLNEHVWHGHFVNAYVRGKWRNEKECGSGFLIAKCCHDTDLLCWLNNATVPQSVSSFGSRSFFTEANAPEGATQYCFNCPRKDECMFNAYTFELEKDFIPFYTWAGINKPLDEITKEEKIEFLKKDVYGQCVFKTDMDIVDRQCVSVEFANGSIATLNMVGGASKAGRHIHLVCEYGEILGYIEENKIIVRVFDILNREGKRAYNKSDCWYSEEVIDLNETHKLGNDDNSITGHYGGDYFIMQDLIRFLNGEKTSCSTTVINDSINGHLICYAAEKARKERRVVEIKEFVGEK